MTPMGHVGISPHTTRPGDKVWILFGDRVRSVLRALEGKSTNLDTTTEGDAGKEVVRERFAEVGSSSVHGIMKGEPIDRYDEKRRTTLLMQMKVACFLCNTWLVHIFFTNDTMYLRLKDNPLLD
jgi:hypothetical protein